MLLTGRLHRLYPQHGSKQIRGIETLQDYMLLPECITFFTTFVVIDGGQSVNSSVISEYEGVNL